MGRAGKLHHEEGIPQVDKHCSGVEAQAHQQELDQHSREQVQQHGGSLEGFYLLRGDALQQPEISLSGGQVGGCHPGVVDQLAQRCGKCIQGGRTDRQGVGIDTLQQQMAIPQVAVDVIGKADHGAEQDQTGQHGGAPQNTRRNG